MKSQTIDIEQLRAEVQAITAAVKTLRKSGISEKALVTLIHKATKPCGPQYNKKKPSPVMIRAVIDGMEGLEAYVFPEVINPESEGE